jgi:hypothetical protein
MFRLIRLGSTCMFILPHWQNVVPDNLNCNILQYVFTLNTQESSFLASVIHLFFYISRYFNLIVVESYVRILEFHSTLAYLSLIFIPELTGFLFQCIILYLSLFKTIIWQYSDRYTVFLISPIATFFVSLKLLLQKYFKKVGLGGPSNVTPNYAHVIFILSD